MATPATSDDNQTQIYKHQQQQGRKELWRQALESSSKGEFFLVSLLEVVIDDEHEQEAKEKRDKQFDELVKAERFETIPYRPSEYSEACRSFIADPLYKVISVILIIAAGVVGAIDAEQTKESTLTTVLDYLLVVWFCIECNIHIAAEGQHPQCYFFGRDAEKWSMQAKWNVFDFSVSYLSLVLATVITETADGSHRVVVLFRLLRLLRLATIVNKTPELTVIVEGFATALNSVVFILFILVLVLYIYAVLGFYLFHQNDPVRFGSVAMSMITLLQCATLSQWDQVMYTQQLGCKQYPGTLYINRTSVLGETTSSSIYTDAGVFPAITCDPDPQPMTAALYFVSFTTLCAFVILSLFTGITTLSMLRQMEDFMRSKRRSNIAKYFREHLYASLEYAVESKQAMYDRLKKSSIGHKGLSKSTKVNLTGDKKLNSPNSKMMSTRILSTNSDVGIEMSPTESKVTFDPSTGTAHTSPSSGTQKLRKQNSVLLDIEAENERDLRLLSKRNKKKASSSSFFTFSFRFSDQAREEWERKRDEEEQEEEQRLLKQQEEEEEEARRLFEAEAEQGVDDDDAVHLAGIYIDVAADAHAITVGGGGHGSDSEDEDSDEDKLHDLELGEITRRRRKRELLKKRKLKWEGDELILSVIEHLKQDPDFMLLEKEHADELDWFSNYLKSLGIKETYSWVAHKCAHVVLSPHFDNFITLWVILAVILVMMESLHNRENEPIIPATQLELFNNVVIMVFILEVVMKVLSENLSPNNYLNNNWNRFDFAVVLLSVYGWFTGGASVSMFRVIRFLQIVKLTKRLAQLRVLVEALFAGFESMIYIIILIVVFNFILAIAAVQYFKLNDRFNFGTVRSGMVTLFRIETLQAWEEVMYVSMFGCDYYYSTDSSQLQDGSCHENASGGYGSFVFFAFIVVFGALILPTLLVGVITAAVRESNFDVYEFAEVDERLHMVLNSYQEVFTEASKKTYDFLFRFCDKSGNGSLTLLETISALKMLGYGTTFEDLAFQVFLCVDRDGSGSVDEAEFFEMIGKILIVFATLDSKSLTYRGMKPSAFAFTNIDDDFEFEDGSGDNGTPYADTKTGLLSEFLMQNNEKVKQTPKKKEGTSPADKKKRRRSSNGRTVIASASNSSTIDVKDLEEEDDEEASSSNDKLVVEGGIFPHWEALSELCDCVLIESKASNLLNPHLSKAVLMNISAHALYRLCFSPLLSVPIIRTLESFEPCSKFLKHIPGYYFGTGNFGTGYYKDMRGGSSNLLAMTRAQRLANREEKWRDAKLIRSHSLWDFLDHLHRDTCYQEQRKRSPLVIKSNDGKKTSNQVASASPFKNELEEVNSVGSVQSQRQLSHLLLEAISRRNESPLYPFDYHNFCSEVNNDITTHSLERNLGEDSSNYVSHSVTKLNKRSVVDENEVKLVTYHESLRKQLARDCNVEYSRLKHFDALFKQFNLANKHMASRENIDHISLEKKTLNYDHSVAPIAAAGGSSGGSLLTSAQASASSGKASLTLKRNLSLKENEEELKTKLQVQPQKFSKNFSANNHDVLTMMNNHGNSGWFSLVKQSTEDYKLNYKDPEVIEHRRVITFHQAIRWRNLTELADVLTTCPNMLVAVDENTGNAALHIAAQNDDHEFLRYVLRQFMDIVALDVNVQNHYGNTPLHMAVEFGHQECVDVLLEYGANKHVKNMSQSEAISGIGGNYGQVKKRLQKHTPRKSIANPNKTSLGKNEKQTTSETFLEKDQQINRQDVLDESKDEDLQDNGTAL